MIKYRPDFTHCTERTYNNISDMKDDLVKRHYEGFTKEDIVIGEQIENANILPDCKNVKQVLIKQEDGEDYVYMYGSPQLIGYCGEKI